MSNIDLLSNAIKQIYETRGDEAFSNSRLFHALLDDIVPTLTNERRILRMAIDDCLLKQLSFVFKDDESNKQYEAIRIKKVFEDNNGLSEKWSLFIIESFANAACIQLSFVVNANLDEEFELNDSSTEEIQIHILADGSKYSGDLLNGAPHGMGKNLYPDGAEYTGEWFDGRKHGFGTFVYPNGNVFTGIFVDGMPKEGKNKYNSGNVYEGEYLNGKRHGQGKYIWVNGDVYEGEFTDGKITGNGIMIKNGVKQSGYFEDGVLKRTVIVSSVPVNDMDSKRVLIEKKEALTKELSSLGIFDAKKKMDIKKQIADIDLKLAVNKANDTLSYLEEIEKGNNSKIRVLKVDDKFSIKGRGTVVVGKLLCEKLYTGDTVIVNDKNYSVSAIEMNKKILKFAEFGDYISILIRGLDLHDTDKGDYIYKDVK